MNHYTRRGFWISALLTFQQIAPCWGPSCAMEHVWLYPGLYPLDATPRCDNQNVSRQCQTSPEGKTALVKNHCSG